ncbi:ATP-binding protein [Roseateles toxinivorans]|uniref:AAA domain-containing protein n=1 Tax=Roseateles toxinivorans TaxID=270368 RepID=A0A4V3CSY2_9BURK|nr:ATP-binding protein [Roseateles toxinivorans]TDP62597.1 AAA domain-containing protein [Roseateles toxinivorans]
MTWRPSQNQDLCRDDPNLLWRAIEGLFDIAVPLAPLPRHSGDELTSAYVTERRGQSQNAAQAMLGRVPKSMLEASLGVTEVELLDVLLRSKGGRVVILRGTRGAGKSTLVNYVEHLCQKYIPDRAPILLNIDGLKLKSLDGIAGVGGLLSAEIANAASHYPSIVVPPEGLVRSTARAKNASAIRDRLAALAQAMQPKAAERLVLVLDNLDHLSSEFVEELLDLAKITAKASGICCVVCIRPQCLVEQVKRSLAGHVYSFLINVPPPKVAVWLSRLPARFADAVKRSVDSGEEPFSFQSQPLLQEEAALIGQRLYEMFYRRRASDDVPLHLLQTVAADDMRRLARMMRRILAHGGLPISVLIGETDLPPTPFHLLRPLFEGAYTIYFDNDLIPNVLWQECADDSPKLLLCQRVLLLLNDAKQIKAETLFRELRGLDYSDEVISAALVRLCNSQLVRCSDCEIYSADARPEYLYITESGVCFRDNFLTNPDYLLAAVTDVALEHAEVRKALARPRGPTEEVSVDFVAVVHSVVEYVREVRDKEARQIYRLVRAKHTPELRRLVFLLRKGGLMLVSLRVALRTLGERMYRAQTTRVHEMANVLSELDKDIERTSQTLLDRLGDIENKARKAQSSTARQLDQRRLGTTRVSIAVREQVDGLTVSPSVVDEDDNQHCFLLGMCDDGGKGSNARAMVAFREDEEPTSSSKSAKVYRGSSVEFPIAANGDSPIQLSLQSVKVPMRDLWRIALLAPSFHDGRLQLTLHVPSRLQHRLDESDIGSGIGVAEMRRLVESALETVGSATGASVVDALNVQGYRLTQALLRSDGAKQLATHLNSVETIIVFVTDELMRVPWEWLRLPEADEGRGAPKLLGQQVKVVRWSANALDAMYRLGKRFEPTLCGTLRTLGLRVGRRLSWRSPCPPSLWELAQVIEKATTVHMVGHFEEGRLVVRATRGAPHVELTADSLCSLKLPEDTRSIVISGCGVGAADVTKNIAAAISRHHGYCVWAPLVDIDENDVETLDASLAQFASENADRSIEEFFSAQHAQLGWPSTYVRFGFGKRPYV